MVSGVLFALGLSIGGMTEPANVIGFLDVAGDWRPALAFVMVGAISVSAVAWLVAKKRRAPFVGEAFVLPSRRDLDLGLLGGAALFGVGWGLGGYCPGPGVVALMSGSLSAVVFVGSMLAGTWLAILGERWLGGARASASSDQPSPSTSGDLIEPTRAP